MVKLYFKDGTRKKVCIDVFIHWVDTQNIHFDKNKMYYENEYIGNYVDLGDTFRILDCLLCLGLLALAILLTVKGGVIL